MRGTWALTDPWSAQTTSQWDTLAPANSSVGGSCAFTNGAYHSNMPQTGYFQPCYAQTQTYTNFAFQVDMTITPGDEGAIILPADPSNCRSYLVRTAPYGLYHPSLYPISEGRPA